MTLFLTVFFLLCIFYNFTHSNYLQPYNSTNLLRQIVLTEDRAHNTQDNRQNRPNMIIKCLQLVK